MEYKNPMNPPLAQPMNWFAFASPSRFYQLSQKIIPLCWMLFVITATAGLILGLLFAPTDAVQGDSYRIIYIHVPAAWMSMLLYLAMAFWAAIGLIFNARLAYRFAISIAPTGALMTFIALWTGALWGKPTWGTWWVWDARLTSELILLFLYIGYLSLYYSIHDERKAAKASSLLAIVGAVNVPIIYFSVKWWNTLHQGATITVSKAPSIEQTMLIALLLMTAAFWLYAFAVIFTRVNQRSLIDESHTAWVQQILRGRGQA